MMEKGPDSVRRGRRRGEMTWMPEKARGCNGEGSLDWGSGEWRVASGEWGPRSSVDGEERFLASLEMTVWDGEMTAVGGGLTVLDGGMAAVGGLGMTVSLLLMRRPESWSWSLKRSWREESRDWTASVARACCSVWNWSIAARSMLLITSTLWSRKGSEGKWRVASDE